MIGTCGTECYSNKKSQPNLTQGVKPPVKIFLGFFAAKGTEITGEPTFVLGDRVRIVATKQQSKVRGRAVVFGGLGCPGTEVIGSRVNGSMGYKL